MELFLYFVKYIFVIALGAEMLVILGALINLARQKARVAAPAAPAEE